MKGKEKNFTEGGENLRQNNSLFKGSKFSARVTSEVHFCDWQKPDACLTRHWLCPIMIYYTLAGLFTEIVFTY